MIEAPATGAVAPGGRGLMQARTWSQIAAVVLLLAVPVVLLAGPAAYRLRLVPLEAAMWGLAQIAFWLSLGAVIAALTTILTHAIRPPRRGVIIGIVVLTFATLALGRLGLMPGERADLPPVYDAQTDWAHPIAFSAATMAERRGAGAAIVSDTAVIGEGRWAGKTVAEAQLEYYSAAKPVDDPRKAQDVPQSPAEARKAAQNVAYYPLKTLKVTQSPAEARKAVEQAIGGLGWTLKPSSADTQVEAANTSQWYGLVSDIAVRIEPDGQGTQINVRSTSRLSTPDMGANANRVKDVLDALKFSLRPPDEKSPSALE